MIVLSKICYSSFDPNYSHESFAHISFRQRDHSNGAAGAASNTHRREA
jgi:hypothetical protein